MRQDDPNRLSAPPTGAAATPCRRSTPTPVLAPLDADTRVRVMARTCAWFADHARDLPWRRPDCSPWGVLVSEFMLQQTPVARVLGPWTEWLERWPTPGALAAEPSGAAVAAWGRLGYPRRALRLHAAASAMVERHGGEVPSTLAELAALPGVGRYTAAAVLSFAHGGDAPVLDTNVRRVLVRVEDGRQFPPDAATASEWRRAQDWLDDAGGAPPAPLWAAASMELGALVCTARSPRCDECPVRADCRWLDAGRPEHSGAPRRVQAWQGSDRQCRGHLLDIVRRANEQVVDITELLTQWHDADQARRCVDGLVADGLLHPEGAGVRL